MDGLTLFMSFVTLIVAVLQIILFFKLWNMTNEVSEIASNVTKKYKYAGYMCQAKEELALGYNDRAKEYLIRARVCAQQELPVYPVDAQKDVVREIDSLLAKLSKQ